MTGRRLRASRAIWVLCLLGCVSIAPEASALAPGGFWEKSFRAWSAQDRKSSAKGGVLFVGSSSIRLWPLASSFPSLPTVNRGLSGSHVDDVLHFADKLVFPYEPKVVVVYAGENDIGAGAAPTRVFDEYRTFVKLVRARLPETRVVLLSIKPSVIHRPLWGEMREANRLIEEFAATDPMLRYVDVATSMLGPTGGPRRELFQEDGLHLNAAGYALWTKLVAPVIEAALAPP